jgi:hypothetical protein
LKIAWGDDLDDLAEVALLSFDGDGTDSATAVGTTSAHEPFSITIFSKRIGPVAHERVPAA